MSRGHRKGYSLRIEKSYWLFEPENSYETDSNRKRQGNNMNGPPKKKMRTENVNGDGNKSSPTKATSPGKKEKNSSKKLEKNSKQNSSKNQIRTECPECRNEVDGTNYLTTDLFNDVESMGSEYNEENAFITELFNGRDNVSSTITDQSEDGSNIFPDILNIFGDNASDDDDDEDRVIITEIFDDTEIAIPDACTNCNSAKKTLK